MPDAQRGLVAAWYRAAWWLWLLRPLELLFCSFAVLRRRCYSWGLLTPYQSEIPVVIVGNITVGGTGKTPVVIALVEALQGMGMRAGVVSRGYGATAPHYPYTVTDDSKAYECGDEPLLIYRRTRCPCVVDPSRARAVTALLDSFAVDVVISDDGLQHYALARSMEIVVLDAERGVGNGFCLPAGPLREPASRLRSVDYVLHHGSDDPMTGVQYQADGLVNMRSGERRPACPESVGNPVNAVAGIGQPLQFFKSLRQQGFEIEQHEFPDHYDFSAADFLELDDRPIIMTEKDAVKCTEWAGDNAWYLSINVQVPNAVIEAVAALARN